MNHSVIKLAACARIPPRGAHFARSTDADGHRLLPPRPAEAKQAVSTRGHPLFCLKGMHLLPGQVARVKRVCLRYVCVRLRLIYTFILIRYV